MKSGEKPKPGRPKRSAPNQRQAVSDANCKGSWAAIGGVVTGAAHLRREKPCQDALLLSPPSPKFTIACVADGHGSGACPHSAEGAALAVELAGDLLAAMLPNLCDHKDIWLPKQLEAKWKDAVRARHAEMERETPDPFPYILYGTTLLALAATPAFIFALQIGDGDILMVDRDGDVLPILPREETAGVDTESLCMADAWQYVRTQFIPWSPAGGPPMFLLATDGYSNSFVDGAGFLKAGADFYNLWREEGLAYIGAQLPGWLRLSSDKGSGDDIALALLVFENSI